MISFDEYQLFKERKEWNEAASSCEQKGGTLPSILSEDESKSIKGLFGRTNAWSGASRGERLQTGEYPWEWVDGSPWSDKDSGGFSKWPFNCEDDWYQNNYWRCDDQPKCMYLWYDWWYPTRCNDRRVYICQFKPSNAEASYSFKKDNIGNSINIYMDLSMDRLQGTNAPGFKVTVNFTQLMSWIQVFWKVEGGLEWPNMEAEVGQLGRGLETPGWGQDYPGSFVSWWAKRHTYKANLAMEKALELMEENDTLVVNLESERWGGRMAMGRGGPDRSHTISTRHIIHEEHQNWHTAQQASFSVSSV